MKLLDEKGRLLGLINIIDLLVLAAILLVLGGAAYKYTHKSAQGERRHLEYVVLVPAVRPEIVAAVKVGDKMVKDNYYTSATIKDIVVKPGYSVNTTASGQRVEAIDPYLKDLLVTIEDNIILSSATITAGGQEVRAGKEYYVKSRDYELKGTILQVNLSAAR
ncbi:DUF4330 domain-containing protein [Desulfurispora thermophila]|uniref:DUF4330 domain-containing protein n=1 Tax=Desulfurispora thermophila TaxID=265470 RepID=UPI000363A9D8|nr:DUF4330 domain-containing protein [Desulfurispora thermophila]